MITLDDARPSNTLGSMDTDQIVIGKIYEGIEVVDKINKLIKPYAGRKYPDFTISKVDIYKNHNHGRKIHPASICPKLKFLCKPRRKQKKTQNEVVYVDDEMTENQSIDDLIDGDLLDDSLLDDGLLDDGLLDDGLLDDGLLDDGLLDDINHQLIDHGRLSQTDYRNNINYVDDVGDIDEIQTDIEYNN